MRLLVVSNLYPPHAIGGYEIGCANIVSALRARGHDVTVLTSPSYCSQPESTDDTLRDLECVSYRHVELAGLDVARLQDFNTSVSHLTNSSVFINAIRKCRPELVVFFNLDGLGPLNLINTCNGLGIPWALYLMDCFPVFSSLLKPHRIRSLFNELQAQVYAPGTILAMSQNLLDELETRGGIRLEQPVHIVPGWSKVPAASRQAGYRREGITRFISAGAIEEHKGIGLIIEAVTRLVQGGRTAFTVELCGWGSVTHYLEMAQQAGVGDFVRFLGSKTQDELSDLYAERDVFLFPTWSREPFGFAPVEAAARGCVPVMTRDCGVAERMVGGVHCLKIDRSVEGLEEAMRSVIDGEIYLPRLGRAAQRLVRSDLSHDRCMNMIETILVQVAKPYRLDEKDLVQARLLSRLRHDLALSIQFGR